MFGNWFHKGEVVEVITSGDDTVDSFYCKPCFSNPVVKQLYKKYLLRVGHCPVCDDFCFIDFDYDTSVSGEYYKVVKRCISHKCNYSKDISSEFNSDLGLSKPISSRDTNRIVNPPSHYYGLGMQSPPKHTGTLKKSFHEATSRNATGLRIGFAEDNTLTRIEVKIVDELPVASEDTLNRLYCTITSNGTYEIYTTIISIISSEDFHTEYEWEKIGEDILDPNEFTVESYYNPQLRKDIFRTYNNKNKNF